LDLILPEELYELVRAHLDEQDGVVRGVYARVFMKLGEILEGDFFTEYIKKGMWKLIVRKDVC
jgi:ribonuclease P/MRP protein subunit RPP40